MLIVRGTKKLRDRARALPAGDLDESTHEEHRERSEWLGAPFDSEAFDPSDFEHNLRDGRANSER